MLEKQFVTCEDVQITVGSKLWVPMYGNPAEVTVCSITSTHTMTLLPGGTGGVTDTKSVDIMLSDDNGTARDLNTFLVWDQTKGGLILKLQSLIH